MCLRFVLTAVHMIAHLLNVEWYNNSRQGVYDKLSTALSNLEDTENTTYLNPIRKTDIVSDYSELYWDWRDEIRQEWWCKIPKTFIFAL